MNNRGAQNGVAPNGINLNTGMRLPFIRKGTTNPSFLSEKFGNQIIAFANAIMNLKVNLRLVTPNQDGSFPLSTFKLATDNAILDLAVPAGDSSDTPTTSAILPAYIITEFLTYLYVQPIEFIGPDTFSVAGDPINVAKPGILRSMPPGAISLYPPYTATDIIYIAKPDGKTGVVVSGENLEWIDINVDARVWVGVLFGIRWLPFSRSYKDYIVLMDGEDPVRVAKHYKNRNSITSEVIYGVTVDFTYPHNADPGDSLYGMYRVATVDSTPENQGYVPQYLADDLVSFEPAETGVTIEAEDDMGGGGEGDPVIYVERDPRIWAQFFDQTFGVEEEE